MPFIFDKTHRITMKQAILRVGSLSNRINKLFKTIEQQISILENRNLLFHNKETATKKFREIWIL